MKKGRSKGKGNSYEIKIARILSQWYEPETKDDLFWRTAGSGAKATVTRRGQTSFVGDITFLPQPDALRVWIDTKDRRDATFDNILSDSKFVIKEWYDEEIKKRGRLKIKKPVLIIFKLYGKKENYVFYRNQYFNLQAYYKWDGNFIQWKCYSIMKLDNFLSMVPRKEIINE